MQKNMIVIAALLAVGCDAAKDKLGEVLSGDQDAGTGAVNVESDAGTVGPVPDEVKLELCDDVANAANAAITLNEKCNVAALVAATAKAGDGLDAVRSACTTALNTCLPIAAAGGAAAEAQIPDIELPSCPLFKGDTSDCDKPVALLEDCLSDFALATAATVKMLDCKTLTVEGATNGLSGLGSAAPDTPACGELQLACPGVFAEGATTDVGVAADMGAAADMGQAD